MSSFPILSPGILELLRYLPAVSKAIMLKYKLVTPVGQLVFP